MDHDLLNQLLHAACESEKELRAAQRNHELSEKILLDTMLKFGKDSYHSDAGSVEVKTGEPRSSTVVDVAVLRKTVDDEVFMDCIKPVVEKIRKHLSGKELAKVAKTGKGKTPDPKLKLIVD